MHQDHSPSAAMEPAWADWLRIVAVMERLAASRDLKEILSLIVDSMRDLLGADRASVLEYDAEAHELFATTAHGVDASLRFGAESGLAGDAVRTKRIINVPDCYADARFNRDIDARTGYRTRSMLTVPLVSLDGRVEGVAQVLNKAGGGPAFDERDEMIARALASQAAVAIRRAKLIEAEKRKEKMEHDLRIARGIQVASLPRTLPAVAGWDLAAATVPAEETGGDAYDVIALPGATGAAARGGGGEAEGAGVLVVMADAAGHGVGPALSVAQAVAMIRMAALGGASLAEIVTRANRLLHESLPVGRFVAAILGVLDVQSGRVEYVAAGVAPLLVVRREGEVEERGAGAPPLGIDASIEIEPAPPVVLERGDALVLLSDGYAERMNGRSQAWGGEQLRAVLGASRGKTAAQMLAALDHAAGAHGGGRAPEDDQTAVIVRRR